MDNNLFGSKELYEVSLKATYPIEINGVKFEKGETIARFDKIQLSGFNQIKKIISANGGFDNRARVIWETTKELDLNFTQGVFSKVQFAIMNNARIFKIDNELIHVPKRETIESKEDGVLELSQIPCSKEPIFVYDQYGKKINYIRNDNIITPENIAPYTYYEVDYYYDYNNGASVVNVGQALSKGFLRFEGKTRLKDDKTGHEVTGLLIIPKLKLVSNLSIFLGENASPIVPTLKAIGYPDGVRGLEKVMEIYFLNDDIDSDIQ